MTQQSIFRWQDGRGWLVLAGGSGYAESAAMLDIEAAVLRRTVSQGPLAYIWSASDIEAGDRYLDHVENLGGRTGYLVDVIREDDDTLTEQLKDAGIIILGDGERVSQLRNGLQGSVQDAMLDAYQRGATIYGHGPAATFLAAWTALPDDGVKPGLGWIEDSLIMHDYSATRRELMQTILGELPATYGVGIGSTSALALGPEGEVELWGEEQVTILLPKAP